MAEQAEKDRLYAESAARSAQASRDWIEASKPHDAGAWGSSASSSGRGSGASGGSGSRSGSGAARGGAAARPAQPSFLGRLVRDMFDFSSKPKAGGGVGKRTVVQNKPWNATAGVVGFLVVTLWVGSMMTGENKWILAAVLGLVGGAIVGRVWKALVLIGVVGGGLWLWGKSNRNSGTTPTSLTSIPSSSSQTASSLVGSSSTYSPVQIGVAKPDFVPTQISAAVPTSPVNVAGPSKPEPVWPPDPLGVVFEQPVNAVFNPTEAQVWARIEAGMYFITIKHAREMPYGMFDAIEYSKATGVATMRYTNGERFMLGLEIPAEDRVVWEHATVASFYLVKMDGTRGESDPVHSVFVERE